MTGLNLVADIGNGTMNVLFINDGRPQSGRMFTEKFGTYQCTLAVREAFLRENQREEPDSVIENVFIGGKANIAGQDLKLIRSVATEYVADIFRRLREHGYDENAMTFYVTGGGGCPVRNFGKYSKSRTVFIGCICATARGMNIGPLQG